MSETIFAKIIRREIPAQIVYETESIVAFRDINPVAPVHVLVIPKKPIVNLDGAEVSDQTLLGELMLAAAEVARREGLAKDGYRIVVNNGANGGQTVHHLHVHVIGGRPCTWPPG